MVVSPSIIADCVRGCVLQNHAANMSTPWPPPTALLVYGGVCWKSGAHGFFHLHSGSCAPPLLAMSSQEWWLTTSLSASAMLRIKRATVRLLLSRLCQEGSLSAAMVGEVRGRFSAPRWIGHVVDLAPFVRRRLECDIREQGFGFTMAVGSKN